MRQAFAMLAGVIALAACSHGAELHRVEAGVDFDDGAFGSATVNNMLVQTGQRDYAVSLGRRFAAAVDTTITFPFDSAVLTPQAQATLQRQAAFIRQFPEVRFAVYGHTDLVGSADYNYRLGLRRAEAAVAYLVRQGVGRHRLEALVSFGETQPLIPTPEPERRNRRTMTQVTGFVADHPTVLNGQYAEIVFREYVLSAASPTSLVGTQTGDFTAQ